MNPAHLAIAVQISELIAGVGIALGAVAFAAYLVRSMDYDKLGFQRTEKARITVSVPNDDASNFKIFEVELRGPAGAITPALYQQIYNDLSDVTLRVN